MYAHAAAASQSRPLPWRPWRQHGARELPPSLRAWLLDESSLTARLVRASNDRFRVRLLGQDWRRPLPAEQRVLGQEDMRRALVREVLLECAGEPWVFARSVIPAATLAGEWRHLRRFGERSLGALLFSTQGVQRGEFEIARLAPGDPLLSAYPGVTATAWARRSLFRLRGRPLLVQEVFLPACRLGAPL